MNREITSKKSGYTQFITEAEWQWIKSRGLTRNYHVKEAVPLLLPSLNKSILKPKIEAEKPNITKTKTKK
jgi:hypothetical protein